MIRFEERECIRLPKDEDEPLSEFIEKVRKYPPSRSCFDLIIENLIQVNVHQ